MMRATSGTFQVNGWSIVKLKVENHDRLHWISSQFKSDLFSLFSLHSILMVLSQEEMIKSIYPGFKHKSDDLSPENNLIVLPSSCEP